MFTNYIKVTLRNLLKNKVYSFIVITGLCVGITCCMLITLFVQHESDYDKFQEKGDRMARVIMEYSMGGNTNSGNYTSTKVGPSFKRNFPEVEDFTRMSTSGKIVKYNDKVFVEKRFLYADSTFFKLFSFPLIEGNVKNALSGPNKLVLTRSASVKYFGKQDPVGKTLKVSSAGINYLVTGVVEDCPVSSHIKFDFIASFSSLGVTQEETYWNANFFTYILLKRPEDIETLQSKIPGFMKNEMQGQLKGEDYLTYNLEPFTKVHLYSEYSGFEANGSITYIYIITAVAALLLIIACFTFINLSTAKSVERAKEIGVRKVAGASRSKIFWQFIGESLILTILSTGVSYVCAAVALPYFNDLIGRQLVFSSLLSFRLIIVVVLMVCSIGFFAGAYPALVLSAFQPVKVLKGMFKNTGGGLTLRKALFVFQFVITVFLIVCAFSVQKQLHYFQSKQLGFDREQVISLPTDQKVNDGFEALKARLKQNTSVKYVTRCDFKPCNIMGGYSMSKPGMAEGQMFSVFAGSIDEEYLRACGIKIIAGQDLSSYDVVEATQQDYEKNYYHFILNESAARQLGWTAKEAIGKKMFLDLSRPGEVKAVVADFHFASLHNPIKPLVLFPGNYCNTLLVKLSAGSAGQVLAGVGKAWKETMPHRPFEYTFLDADYLSMYTSEISFGKAVTVFTILALLLAVLGLFGLSSYSIQQRTKEIGILKVLGAPVPNIIKRLSVSFIWLVVIAIFISVPVAWWVMNIWLRDFSYRIEMNLWLFVLPGLAAVTITLLTVGLKALSAASVNPTKNLRTE